MGALRASNTVSSARSRVARASRQESTDDLDAARRGLTSAKVERAIREALDAEPPLTADQRARLATLLKGGDQ